MFAAVLACGGFTACGSVCSALPAMAVFKGPLKAAAGIADMQSVCGVCSCAEVFLV